MTQDTTRAALESCERYLIELSEAMGWMQSGRTAEELQRVRAALAQPQQAAPETVAHLVALELERLAQDPPISGNTLAQSRVLMAAASVREFGIAGGAAPAGQAAAPDDQKPWFPHFSIVATICRFALRQSDVGVLEAASHQVERLMDVVRDHYHPTQHKMLAALWLQSRKEIKEGRRPMSRLVPSAPAAEAMQPAQAVQWIPMHESAPEPGTECVVLLCYSMNQKPFASVDRWEWQHEDPIGMGGPTICTGQSWQDNDPNDVIAWFAIPKHPPADWDQRLPGAANNLRGE